MRTAILSGAVLLIAAFAIAEQQHFDGRSWWHRVEILSADKMEGRGVGTPGEERAEVYVIDELRKAGLASAGIHGYYQPVRFEKRQIVEKQSSAALVREGEAHPLILGEDAIFATFPDLVPPLLDIAPETDAPLVFIGHGIRIPEVNHDDFAGMDLKGKIAVTLDAGPPEPGLSAATLDSYYDAERRWQLFRDAGVVGWITIPRPAAWSAILSWHDLPTVHLADPEYNQSRGRYLIMLLNPERADKLFEGSGHTVAELFALAKDQKPLPHFSLPGSLRATVQTLKTPLTSANVIAKLEGSDPQLKNQYVVISAHIDHLGIGKPVNGDPIYHGAIDNASGVAVLLDIAAELKRKGLRPKRSVLFAFFTGEESRMLGSKYFITHPTVDTKSIVANMNVDAVHAIMPMKELRVLGMEESDLGDMAQRAAASENVSASSEPELGGAFACCSDEASFAGHGIPAVALKVGFPGESRTLLQKFRRERYHTPLDNAKQPIDLETAATFEEILLQLLLDVANDPHRPKWKPGSFYGVGVR